ncbi:TetR/AcrR family transcriptional regulator [Streptacidiphilus jiangxiensis]|uniref:DNA-binding transcriptional regulator, AcrR family n=1 Tax=Streptacidiphilus jiangxiensis TaxID=235985 RepID=A0A1H7UBB8_STRJI|nr:TetR/AcrR family transcriptional regulator [Streptacidiphilus jiangxiensis]SEL93597.1 DNA-binding transcriptional regulator, AcrR family [Streptacidiphilus jiangxiensis]
MAPVIRTARERAREELTLEIKREARRQLADEGAQRLSLRAVARELGMASSALYRYFPSRDDLLTALIMDAYNALGERAEAAVAAAPADDPRERWRALCGSVRDWAKEHPHEYALLYGTPVPGYRAPEETVTAALRVILALLSVLRGAAHHLDLRTPVRPLRGALAEQAAGLVAVLTPEVSAGVLTRAVVAWTQLFGMISFELFGHLVGSFDPADEFFAHSVEEMADFVGLP